MTSQFVLITTANVTDTSRRVPTNGSGGVSGILPAALNNVAATFSASGASAIAGSPLTSGINYAVSTSDGYYAQGVATSTSAISIAYWLNTNPALNGGLPTGTLTCYGTVAAGSLSSIVSSGETVIEDVIIHHNITANTTLSILDASGTVLTTFVAQFATTAGTNILPYPLACPLGVDGMKLKGMFSFTVSVGAQLTASIFYRVTGGRYSRNPNLLNTPA